MDSSTSSFPLLTQQHSHCCIVVVPFGCLKTWTCHKTTTFHWAKLYFLLLVAACVHSMGGIPKVSKVTINCQDSRICGFNGETVKNWSLTVIVVVTTGYMGVSSLPCFCTFSQTVLQCDRTTFQCNHNPITWKALTVYQNLIKGHPLFIPGFKIF